MAVRSLGRSVGPAVGVGGHSLVAVDLGGGKESWEENEKEREIEM